MAYLFVPAYHKYGIRRGPVRAFVVHMAEGGGTVGFLSRPNARGVSVHYVIERTGRIVQMLHEREASGSINPNDLRTTEGPAPYGAKVRREVMADWDNDPNSAVISLELEGFAADGPNGAQTTALVRLVDDVRGRFPAMGLLGHRDFQDYKACPGTEIPWGMLGGHGYGEGSTGVAIFTRDPRPGHFICKAGTMVSGYDLSGDTIVKAKERSFSEDSSAPFAAVLHRTTNASPTPLLECTGGAFAGLYVPTSGVEEHFDPIDPTTATDLTPGLYRVP